MHTGIFRAGLVVSFIAFFAVTFTAFVYSYRYLAPDSFTYFVMAQEFYQSDLLYSYSGIDHTTGAHPAWYWLLLAMYPFFGLSIPAWVFFIGALLVGIGVYALQRAYGVLFATVMLLCAATVPGLEVVNNGMESSLLFLVLSLLGWWLHKIELGGEEKINTQKAAILGVLLGLVVLARLDAVFVVLGGALALLFRNIRLRGWFAGFLGLVRPGSIALAFFMLVLAPALVGNYIYGGSLLPVSGALKSSFPAFSGHVVETFISLKLFLASLLVSGTYLLWNYIRGARVPLFASVLFISTLFLYAYNAFFVSDIGAWYGTLPFVLLASTFGFIARDAHFLFHERKHVSLVFLLFGAGMLCLIAYSHFSLAVEDWVSPHKDAAEALGALSDPDDRAAELKDGVFAFYAQMPVYSLTGLANNQAYIDAQRNGEIEAYLEDRRIKYIIGGSLYSGVQVPGATVDFRGCVRPLYDSGLVRIYHTSNCFE